MSTEVEMFCKLGHTFLFFPNPEFFDDFEYKNRRMQ